MAATILQVRPDTCIHTNICFINILQVNSNQVESLMGEAEPLPMHPMMEGDELLECQLGEEEPEEISVKKETIQL